MDKTPERVTLFLMPIPQFLTDLFTQPSVAHNLIVIALTIALGLTIGRIQIGKIPVSVTGVLFAGILLSQLGFNAPAEIIDFVRDFGLIIFVYTIGVQVGPRFFTNMKSNGISLNILAATIVFIGTAIAWATYQFGLNSGTIVGLFTGATSNTPSLGAAQQMLATQSEELVNISTLAYAVSFPFGIVGVILTMLLIKWIGRVDIQKEAEQYNHANSAHVIGLNLSVENKNLNGITISQIPDLMESQIVISRLMHDNKIIVPHSNTIIHTGDVIRAVGPKESMLKLQLLMGSPSNIALENIESDITGRRVIVTRREIVGKTISELQLRQRFGITATRISHDDYELPASGQTIIYYGDSLWIVGEPEDIEKFATYVGDSEKALNHPFILPIFSGLVLGVIVGQIPITLPGFPSAVKIGTAGGPLLIALIASRFGRFGHVVWYMPTGANLLMRKFGISLFLAAVGLKSGSNFFGTVMSMQGLTWLGIGAAITLIPTMAVGLWAYFRMRMNFLTVCGLLSGSTTNPPALAFANSLTNCSAQSVTYSTVYPLTMILRIICGQLLVILLTH